MELSDIFGEKIEKRPRRKNLMNWLKEKFWVYFIYNTVQSSHIIYCTRHKKKYSMNSNKNVMQSWIIRKKSQKKTNSKMFQLPNYKHCLKQHQTIYHFLSIEI